MSLKYYGRKVYDKRNGQICRPQKCRVKFGKNLINNSSKKYNSICQVWWVKNSLAKRALWNFSRPYLTKFFVQGFQATLGPLASLCMLATLATQSPMLCFSFTSAALMFFALTSFGQKTGHPASSICQALDKYYCHARNLDDF